MVGGGNVGHDTVIVDTHLSLKILWFIKGKKNTQGKVKRKWEQNRPQTVSEKGPEVNDSRNSGNLKEGKDAEGRRK